MSENRIEQRVTVRLRQVHDYQFDVDAGAGIATLRADEPPPLGQGAGPSPVQLLAAAVGNCLADSLLFALRKFRNRPEPIAAEVEAQVGRNAEGRLRVLGLQATLTLGVPAEALEHAERAIGSFTSYCTVTQSIGIPVDVQVFDAHGARLR